MTGLSEAQARDWRTAARLRECAEDLAVYVATWQDGGTDGAGRRRALADAVKAIDDMLRAVHLLRQSLVSQARQFDDATAARVDALLEHGRKEGLS